MSVINARIGPSISPILLTLFAVSLLLSARSLFFSGNTLGQKRSGLLILFHNKTMRLAIIKAAPAHFVQLQQIERAAFACLLAEGAVTGSPTATDQALLSRYLEADALYVAQVAGEQIVGFCGGYLLDNRLHIAEMDVHPDWQRRGIGRMLMKKMLQRGTNSQSQRRRYLV